MRRLRIVVAVLAIVATISSVPGAIIAAPVLGDCGYQEIGSDVSRPAAFGVGPAEVVELVSEVDGEPIQMGIVRPAAAVGYRSPVIVLATPYISVDLRDVDLYECSAVLIRNFVVHGYTVVELPVRGTGGSGGCSDFFGESERRDLSQAVTWLGTQPWSNGSVGMLGLSYDGTTPWQAAATGNPYLKTIVPADGANDIFELIFGGGETDWRWWFFTAGYWGLYGYAMQNPVYSGRDLGMTIRDVTGCPELLRGERATLESWVSGEEDSLGYWAERRLRERVKANYRGSVYLVQGMQDWNVRPGQQFPWINELESAANIADLKITIGQWGHRWPTRSDFADGLLVWFDRWLKGLSVDTGPTVQVQDSSGRWRVEESWPPATASQLTLYPGASGSLTPSPSGGRARTLLGPDLASRYYYIGEKEPGDPTPFTSNHIFLPAALEKSCVTCLAVTMPVVGSALHISGLPELHLSDVVPTGPGGVVTALLYRYAPGGQAVRIGWGDVDLRFPAIGQERSSAVAPGESMAATIRFEPLDAVVPAGETLLLILGQGNADHMPTWSRFPVMLNHGGDLVTLRLPILPTPS